jgi:hypothetical protein
VSKDADEKEIKRAYRRLALLFHPDRNKSPGAEERFKEISEAYAVLSGKERPPPETEIERRRGVGMGEYDAWAFRVASIWRNLEEERHNNMYR